MEQVTWQTIKSAKRGLAEIELRISGGEFFEAYLGQLQCNGEAQCTTVWTKSTIAYRCRTCQVNDSSAICASCFQAGDHRHHDYGTRSLALGVVCLILVYGFGGVYVSNSAGRTVF